MAIQDPAAARPHPTRQHPSLHGADLAMMAVVVFWGTSFSVIKGAYREIGALAFTGMRFIVTFFAMMPVLWWQRHNLPTTREGWVAVITLGISGVAAYQLLFSVGLQYTTASNSSVLASTGPLFTALWIPILGLGRLRPKQWLGIPLALAGVYMLSITSRGAWGWDWGHAQGDLLTLAAGFATGTGYALAGKYLGHSAGVATMSLAVVFGGILMMPFTWGAMAAHPWGSTGPGTWLALLYAALVAGAAGYIMWYQNIGRLGAMRGSMYAFLIPVVGVGVAVTFLGEPLGPYELLGAGLVLAGIALTRHSKT